MSENQHATGDTELTTPACPARQVRTVGAKRRDMDDYIETRHSEKLEALQQRTRQSHSAIPSGFDVF